MAQKSNNINYTEDENFDEKMHEHMIERTNLLRKTQAFKTIEHCFESLENKPHFISSIREIRKLMNLPINGFSLPNFKKSELGHIEKLNYILKARIEIIKKKISAGEKALKEAQTKMLKLEEEYDLEICRNALECYIDFGETELIPDHTESEIAYVLPIRSMLYAEEQLENTFGNSSTTVEIILSHLSKKYPVAILVNPYMSERSIIDFIKVTYTSWIEPAQKTWRTKLTPLGKARKKSAKDLKRFIYINRNKPLKDIRTLVSKEFRGRDNKPLIMDYTYIQKIIRDEKGKRK